MSYYAALFKQKASTLMHYTVNNKSLKCLRAFQCLEKVLEDIF